MAEVFGDYIQVVARYTLSGWDDQINVFNLQNGNVTPLPSGDATAIASAFEDWFTAHAGAVSDQYTLAELTIRDMADASAPGYVFSVGISGTDAAALLPPGTALVMTLNTGLSGRSFRGRVFLGGFCEDNNDVNGRLDTGAQATIEGNFGDLVAALVALDFPLSVVSKVSGGVDRPSAVVTNVATFQCNTEWDRQKRRGS